MPRKEASGQCRCSLNDRGLSNEGISLSHFAKEQPHEVDASNLEAAFGDVDDIPIENHISISPSPQGYNAPLKVTSQTIIVAPSLATIDSLIQRCKHIPRLRKIVDRFFDYQHSLPQTGYLLTEVENELLMDFYKYYTHRLSSEHCIYRRPIEFTQSDIPYYRQRIVINIFKQNWIRNTSKLNLPPLPVLSPDLQ